jgi:hypothetical protein
MTMNRALVIAVTVALLIGGCQTKPPSKWVPVPLPMELAPSTKLTVVGTGATAEEAREAAINQMVHQVILPPSEPEDAPTADFVESLIRGYNVAGVAQDFLGKYYVTIELTISQLGINYQELYHICGMHQKEIEALKKDILSEEQLRKLAEQRAERANERLDQDRKTYENRMLELQAQKKLDEQRIDDLSQQRLKDEKAMRAYEDKIDELKAENAELRRQAQPLRPAPAAPGDATP